VALRSREPLGTESGGQVGDSGTIQGPTGRFQVLDTKKENDFTLHVGQDGSLTPAAERPPAPAKPPIT